MFIYKQRLIYEKPFTAPDSYFYCSYSVCYICGLFYMMNEFKPGDIVKRVKGFRTSSWLSLGESYIENMMPMPAVFTVIEGNNRFDQIGLNLPQDIMDNIITSTNKFSGHWFVKVGRTEEQLSELLHYE